MTTRRVEYPVHAGAPNAAAGYSPFVEERDFVRLSDGRYQFVVPELSTEFDLEHVRTERYQLQAQVTVYCGLAGARTWNRILFTGSVNFSNLRDREQFVRILATSTKTGSEQWAPVVNELSARLKKAEDIGAGVVSLRDVALRTDAEQFYRLGRLLLPQRHPAIIFGDGDSLKTYLANYLTLELLQQGVRVAVADWEMTQDEHKQRAVSLGNSDADIVYIPCVRPLVHEADRIAKAVHAHGCQYLLLDSAGPACNGRPEDAENASAYFRALRSIGIGSLTIAHANRSESSDQKPFGSVFWFNLARAIWYVKRAEQSAEGITEIGLYPRKFNLGAVQKATAFRFRFTDTRTIVTGVDIAEVDTLAAKLPLKDRISQLVRSRARSVAELAVELDADSETVSRTIRRYSGDRAKFQLFTHLPDGRVGLIDRRAS